MSFLVRIALNAAFIIGRIASSSSLSFSGKPSAAAGKMMDAVDLLSSEHFEHAFPRNGAAGLFVSLAAHEKEHRTDEEAPDAHVLLRLAEERVRRAEEGVWALRLQPEAGEEAAQPVERAERLLRRVEEDGRREAGEERAEDVVECPERSSRLRSAGPVIVVFDSDAFWNSQCARRRAVAAF